MISSHSVAPKNYYQFVDLNDHEIKIDIQTKEKDGKGQALKALTQIQEALKNGKTFYAGKTAHNATITDIAASIMKDYNEVYDKRVGRICQCLHTAINKLGIKTEKTKIEDIFEKIQANSKAHERLKDVNHPQPYRIDEALHITGENPFKKVNEPKKEGKGFFGRLFGSKEKEKEVKTAATVNREALAQAAESRLPQEGQARQVKSVNLKDLARNTEKDLAATTKKIEEETEKYEATAKEPGFFKGIFSDKKDKKKNKKKEGKVVEVSEPTNFHKVSNEEVQKELKQLSTSQDAIKREVLAQAAAERRARGEQVSNLQNKMQQLNETTVELNAKAKRVKEEAKKNNESWNPLNWLKNL